MKPSLLSPNTRLLLALAATLACHQLAQAQTAPRPSSGDLQRSLNPMPTPSAPAEQADPLVEPKADADSSAAASGPRLAVKSLRIVGVSVLPEAKVRAMLDDLIGHSWTVAELQRAVARVTRYYQSHGYSVARAVLPAQDVHDGELEVLVLEGRVGRSSVSNASLIKDSTVARLLGPLPDGQVVQGPELSRRLLILGDTPGTSRAWVTLQPGQQTGETDLLVRMDAGKRVHGELDLDNNGNRYTGYNRVSADVQVNSPLGLGDQLALRGLVTDGSTTGLVRMAYRVPVAPNGWTVGGAWSRMNYFLGREYAPLEARGWAQQSTLDVGSTLYRAPRAGLLWRAAWDHKTFSDSIDSVGSNTRKQSDQISGTLNGYGVHGQLDHAWTAVFSRGKLDLSTDSLRATDASSGANTLGYFNKLVLTGNANWAVKPGWSVYGSAYTQLASRNLDGSEKLSLGGVNGVRAYPDGEGLGDEGVLGTVELRYTLPLRPIQLAAFMDGGYSQVNRYAYQTNTDNGRTLRGAGLSVVWAPTPDIGIKLMGATRLGHGPVETEPTDSRTRYWLQSTLRF